MRLRAARDRRRGGGHARSGARDLEFEAFDEVRRPMRVGEIAARLGYPQNLDQLLAA